MTREAALRDARRRFGNATSAAERSREIWAYPLIENLVHDFRYALRMLTGNPMFAAVVVLPLALGIGANTAIFTIVDAALLRSLPYRQPDRLVHLFETKDDGTQPHEASYPDFQDWKGAHQFVEQVAGYTPLTGWGPRFPARASRNVSYWPERARDSSRCSESRPRRGAPFCPTRTSPGHRASRC